MSKINTDLTSSPYWDDFNEDKQFYKILFVPKRAVQVREINQLQSMFQTQIKRHADHIFKDGSIVSGCNITYEPNLNFVYCNFYNNDTANSHFTTDVLENFMAVSVETGLRAYIRMAVPGFFATYPESNIMYIDYLNKGRDTGNNEVMLFSPGETLEIYDSEQDKFGELDPGRLYNTIDIMSPDGDKTIIGNAYAVTVGDGIVYQKGYFVNVHPNTVLVRKYDTNTDGMMVGFETHEKIITYLQDPSLIDPVDNSQRNGIGADRLKLTPLLVAKHKSEITTTDDFFPIIEFGNEKVPVKQNSDPEYAKLGDQMAKEQLETHGDFYVKPFIVSTKNVANTSNFAYTVDAGIAYVKGNRVNLINTINLEQPRSNELGFYNANITTLNYGNYINVNQLIGTFNADKLIRVNIYNAPQTGITSSRNPNSPTGTLVGTANVRAVLYDSGAKGTPTAQYKFYLTNIVMNSGRSFNNDAKSFVVNATNNQLAYGACADIVLTGTKAVIKESSSAGLIFNSGVTGTRRLRDPQGVNDTSFTLRDTATATLQANGSVTFTLNTPYAGGAERFFASTGTLSAVNKLRVDITTTAPLLTNDLAGTVNGASGNTSLIGTGTSFTTNFKIGEYVDVAGTPYRITNISNNTLMTVHTNVTGGSGTASYSKMIIAGNALDLTNSVVTVVSNTQFIVDTGHSFASGAPQTLIATYPVLRSEAYEIKKDVRRGTYVKIDCSTAGVKGPYNLGLVDVFSIENIWVGTTYSENNPDRKAWFTLDNGQQPSHYDHAKLLLKSSAKLTSASRILVKLNHFTANTATGIGFFTADSYPTRAPGAVANTTNISYDDIPEVFGYNLRNAIDFRPQKFNTANVTTSAGSATVNPVASNTSFNVGVGGSYIGEPDSNFQADVEYYLSRIDLIQVNKDGNFSVKSSNSAERPITPVADQDAMSIAIGYVPPYPGVTADQITRFVVSKPKIKTTLASIRGYTMKDINALDKRISVLEYYQALSMLEQQAKDYVVKDENGLDRFKNGIFADPLKNHLLGDVSNYEYNIAIDELNQLARPKFNKHNVDLDIYANTGVKFNGRIASINYTRQLYVNQPYATKYRNVVDGVYNWKGEMNIFPEYDHYQNEKSLPAVNVEIDLASPWEDFANTPFAQNFGNWRTTDTSTSTSTTTTGTTGLSTTTTTTTTSTTLSKETQSLAIGTSITKNDLGSYVTDVTLNPYMRSRQVAFIATGLRPSTRFWAYFADVNVSNHCAMGTINTSIYNQTTGEFTIAAGKEDTIVKRKGNFGAPLLTDSNGSISGIFKIPDDTFRVGDRLFQLVDVDSLELGGDAVLSSASAMYTASALTTSSRNISLTTINPTVSATTSTETRVETATTITQRVTAVPSRQGNRRALGKDPLGQTFYVETPNDVPGVFLEAFEVFFKDKDKSNLGITCYITEMNAGVPNPARVLATSYLKPAAVKTSVDSSLGTIFKFNEIPYLTKDKYYAVFFRPDGDNPNYTLWMSELGGIDILTGEKIFTNPYAGVAVKSANSETWDVLMTEDIKFNAYICKFNTGGGSITLADQDDDYFTVEGFAMANTNTSIQVGDVVYSVHPNNVVIAGNNAPFGYVQEVDQVEDTLIIDSSTGGFTANTKINIYRPPEPGNNASISNTNLIATSRIVSVDDLQYSIVVPKIATSTPTGTTVAMSYKGIGTNQIEDASFKPIQPETELEMIDKIRVIKSKSNRNIADKSAKIKIDLKTTSAYLSPIVDLRRRSLFCIENIINNSVVDEHTRNGESLVRYISKMITLAEGQDAEDIKVLLTGYRPAGTNIHCYAKILCADDPDNFYDKLWTKLEMVEGASVNSSSIDVNDFREFGFTFPSTEQMQGTAYKNLGNSGIVEYRNDTGTIFVGYKQFAIKVILTASQKQLVPRLDDIRGICLQL